MQELQKRLIAATTQDGDYVLDPASGGYSVYEACKALGRDFIFRICIDICTYLAQLLLVNDLLDGIDRNADGYATSNSYVNNNMRLVRQYNLTRFDGGVTMGRTAQDYLNVWRSWLGFSEADGRFRQIIDLYNSHKPLARGYAVKYTDDTKTTGTTGSTGSTAPSYKVGKVYTITASALVVRTGPGTKYRRKRHNELTRDGQNHDPNRNGCLVRGTRISCLEVRKSGKDIWVRCPSGWVAGYYDGNIYVQ